MTDKERIKIICNDARVITDNDNKMIRCHINIKHFDWLIEQAERVQRLEEIKSDAIKQIDVTHRRNKRLEERVQELEEELKIYKTIAKNNKHAGETLLHEVSKENRKLIKENKFLNERRLHHKKRNKRYREAIKIAVGKFNYDEHQEGMSILQKALEENK